VGQVFRADVLSGSVSNIFPFGRPGRGLAISDDGSRLIFYALGISRTNYFYFRDMSVATNRLLLEVPTDVGSFQVSKDSQNLFFTMAPTNHGFQLFWHSLLTSETTLLTTNAIGEPINGSVLSPFSISESGAVVAFETTADDLVSKDLNRAPDIFRTAFRPSSGFAGGNWLRGWNPSPRQCKRQRPTDSFSEHG
jgi:hypothetical protein